MTIRVGSGCAPVGSRTMHRNVSPAAREVERSEIVEGSQPMNPSAGPTCSVRDNQLNCTVIHRRTKVVAAGTGRIAREVIHRGAGRSDDDLL